MKTIVAATTNKGKIAEIQAILEQAGIDVISRDEAGIPPDVEIEETGSTFEENSQIKAKGIMKMCGMAAMADDSGLVVDCLDGAPGVMSARFAGEDGNDEANRKKLIAQISNFPEEERTARFVCAMTIAYPDGETMTVDGTVEGRVIPEERGGAGFGYDPMFIPEGYDKTFGEFALEEKNKISHRAIALKALMEKMAEMK